MLTPRSNARLKAKLPMLAWRKTIPALGAILALASCSDPGSKRAGEAQGAHPNHPLARPLRIADPPPLPTPPLPAGPADVGQQAASVDASTPAVTPVAATPASPLAAAVNNAVWPAAPQARRAALIRAEVLLARARFSPGVIDGQDGGNLKNAIAAYEASRGLPVDGRLSGAVWKALVEADSGAALVSYVISPQDVAGPFSPPIPTDYGEMAKLPHLGFTSPLEALAEKFHMDEALLRALNPGVDFGAAGTRILVADPGPETLPAPVTAIEVDKSQRQVRAYGPDGALLAAYPATVGSTERPAPTGAFEVKGIAPNPTYTYDPKRLTFGDRKLGKLTIKPGPNNPVGAVWIDLSIPTYGIHGAPDPRLVGKVASHGCVRLTNWDVRQLASGVKKGVQVLFVGSERPAHPRPKLSSASAGWPTPRG